MPRSKLNSKMYHSSVRSFSPVRFISFQNSINSIINKFENSEKRPNNVFDCKKPTTIPASKELNFYNYSNIYSGNCRRPAQANKTKLTQEKLKPRNKSASKMVDSMNEDVIDCERDPDRDSPNDNNIDNDQLVESDEMFDSIETIDDPNIYEPMDSEQIAPPTKFMRLRNINIVRYQLNVFQRFVGILLSFPFFSSVNGAGLSTLICAFFMPRFLCENIIYPIFRLILGTLYPAYASYKAVRNKDVKDYVSCLSSFI